MAGVENFLSKLIVIVYKSNDVGIIEHYENIFVRILKMWKMIGVSNRNEIEIVRSTE